MNWAKLYDRWGSVGYERGDVVIFDWERNGRMDHTRIVEAVFADGKTLTTIEGNTSTDNDSNGGAVMRRERNVKYVVDAFRPTYEDAEAIKDNAWAQAGIDYLMENGLINQKRAPGAPVTWGEFGIVQQ
jgi:hypothetical protein